MVTIEVTSQSGSLCHNLAVRIGNHYDMSMLGSHPQKYGDYILGGQRKGQGEDGGQGRMEVRGEMKSRE